MNGFFFADPADADKAFQLSFYPNDGVGLMRMEFNITHFIKVHPMALVKFGEMKDTDAKKEIEALTYHYPSKGKVFSPSEAFFPPTVPTLLILISSNLRIKEIVCIDTKLSFAYQEGNDACQMQK